MKPSDLTVVIVTNNRCPPLLRHVVDQWNGRATVILRSCDEPDAYSDVLQDALDAVTTPFALQSGDDIIPVGEGWPEALKGDWGGIQAVRLLDVEGRDWFSWADWSEGRGASLQAYAKPARFELNPDPSLTYSPSPYGWTYITGGAQLIGRDVFRSVSYRGRGFGKAGDVFYCRDALLAGHRLRAPTPNGPTLIHMERRWPGNDY